MMPFDGFSPELLPITGDEKEIKFTFLVVMITCRFGTSAVVQWTGRGKQRQSNSSRSFHMARSALYGGIKAYSNIGNLAERFTILNMYESLYNPKSIYNKLDRKEWVLPVSLPTFLAHFLLCASSVKIPYFIYDVKYVF